MGVEAVSGGVGLITVLAVVKTISNGKRSKSECDLISGSINKNLKEIKTDMREMRTDIGEIRVHLANWNGRFTKGGGK